uniref:Uncharacterized protein n=1 Tax=Aegilops tauschii subsp. strangulata TaxID=200361 RepID=A0A453H7T9_AEGTS
MGALQFRAQNGNRCDMIIPSFLVSSYSIYCKRKFLTFLYFSILGLAVVSFQPPRFDYGVFCEEPSLPLPCNNPYPNKWTTPKTKKRKRNEQQEPEPIPEAVCHYARRVQPPPVNPCPPFDTREWPKFPRYSTLVNSA